jgi:hypothetical protein
MRNLLAVLGLTLLVIGCGSEPDVKNRVPTMQGQIEEAQKAVHDAKGYADQAAQTKKDIQAALDRLDHAGLNSNGSKKIGAPEVSGAGIVTEVGSTKVSVAEEESYTLLWFTFAERAGFTKKFESVCANQTVPVNKTVMLNFHWRGYNNQTDPGCYIIDGYTVVQ